MMVDMKNQTVVVSPKFQVVIPREIREAGGILPGSRMSVFEINGVIQLVPVKTPNGQRMKPRQLNPERF